MITDTSFTKRKVQTSLLFSTRYFFKHKYNKKFIIGDHHRIIAETLERVLKGELTRVIFHVAPRYGKTEVAVKNFIAHGLALNAASKFIHLSYSDDLALDNSENIKEIVNLPEYQMLFPQVQIKKGSDSKKKWYTTSGGGVYATAAAGQVTGFGAGIMEEEDIGQAAAEIDSKEGFGGAIVIDDPIKPEDADSEVLRERVNQRFDSTIRNRVNSRKTPIIIIMQKLHERDLSGYLQENEPGVWHVVSLPVINEKDNPYGLEAGAALWSHKHTLEELLALQKANEKVFDTQYLQDPTTKAGKLFPKTELRFYNPSKFDPYKDAEARLGAIDPSDTGADSLAFAVGCLHGKDIYIPDVIYNNDGMDSNQVRCVDMIMSSKLQKVAIESNGGWRNFTRYVKGEVIEKFEDCEVRATTNHQHKATRIWAESSFVKTNFVFREDYLDHPEYSAFMKNVLNYNKSQEGTSKNKHEDAVDDLTELAKLFRKELPHVW